MMAFPDGQNLKTALEKLSQRERRKGRQLELLALIGGEPLGFAVATNSSTRWRFPRSAK
jgi:hypothetical protein